MNSKLAAIFLVLMVSYRLLFPSVWTPIVEIGFILFPILMLPLDIQVEEDSVFPCDYILDR